MKLPRRAEPCQIALRPDLRPVLAAPRLEITHLDELRDVVHPVSDHDPGAVGAVVGHDLRPGDGSQILLLLRRSSTPHSDAWFAGSGAMAMELTRDAGQTALVGAHDHALVPQKSTAAFVLLVKLVC